MLEQIRNILAEVLSADPDTINEDSNLVSDLAAESIDFVDIAFHVEKAFGLKNVSPAIMFPAFLREQKEIFADGKLLPAIRARLTSEYPFLGDERIDRFEATQSFEVFFDVGVLASFVQAYQAKAA
jgi:acyl carrier protein